MFGSVSRPDCFDESSPCMEEQTAYCVIDIAQKADAGSKFPGQDKIVPWTICHGKGSSLEDCHSQVGIDAAEVHSCLADTSRIHGLMQQYITRGSKVSGTPYEEVNGKEVGGDADYYAIKQSICRADSSLSACSGFEVQV